MAYVLCLSNGQRELWSLNLNSVSFDFEERVAALENMETPDGPTKFVKLRRDSREFLNSGGSYISLGDESVINGEAPDPSKKNKPGIPIRPLF
jgi:hypothetical protein